MVREQPGALTAFQIQVTRLFFTLPASEGFLLAGGAALVAQHLTERPTRDLDLFTRPPGDVVTVRDALENALAQQGWTVERIRDTSTFCRLVVHGPEDLLVDLAVDLPPQQPASLSYIGPTFAPEELAGRKLLALFDRAEARDFTDVFALAQRYGKERLLQRAGELDAGFDHHVLAGQFETLARFDDAELPADDCAGTRTFFAGWSDELTNP